MTKKETLEQQREHLVQEEQKENPVGHVNDKLNYTQAGMPNTNGLSTKEIGVTILSVFVLFIVYSTYKLF